jgi:hypothetical protein
VLHTRTTSLTLGLSALLALAVAVPASANRAGVGPVRQGHLVSNYHLSFTLLGDSWSQIAGALGGTPSLGSYTYKAGPVAPNASAEHLRVTVSAFVTVHKPLLKDKRIVVKPTNATSPVINVEHHGLNGPVTWWTGTLSGAPAAVGYQRAPRGLDRSQKQWLVYQAYSSVGNREAHPRRALREAVSKIRAIAKTMRLAPGPTLTQGPFAGP